MNPEHNTHKKIIQTTEEAFRPIHVPLMLANECFIITQQDIRRIEDSRLLIYSKLLPSGELKALEGTARDILAEILVRLRSSMNANITNDKYLAALINVITNRNVCGDPGTIQPMDIENIIQQNSPTVATLQQQLHWDRNVNTSLPTNTASTCCMSISKGKASISEANNLDKERMQTSTGIQTCDTYCCCKNCTSRDCKSKTHNSIGTNTPLVQDTSSQTSAIDYPNAK